MIQTACTEEAKTLAVTLYTPSGTLTAGAAGTTVVAEGDGKDGEDGEDESIIRSVRLVAEADIGDGSVRVGGVNVEGQSLHFGEEIEAYMSTHMDEILDAIKNSMLSMDSGTEVEVHIVGRKAVQDTNNNLLSKLEALKQGTITVDSYAVLGQYQNETPYDASQAFIDAKDQILYGNYSEKVTILGTAGQIVIGFTGVDVAADFRDIVYDIDNWEWSWGHAGSTGLDAVGLLPIVGVIKNVKHADEIALLVKNGEKIEVVSGVRKRVEATEAIIEAEGTMGHALLKHVGLSDSDMLNTLKADIAAGRNVTGISSFTDSATLEYVQNQAKIIFAAKISDWLATKNPGSVLILSDLDLGIVLGRGVNISSRNIDDITENDFTNLTKAVVQFIKNQDGTYSLFTAYPV